MDLSSIPPQQRAEYIRNLQALEGLPPGVRALVAKEAIDSQKAVNQQIYYSTVKFASVRSGAGPFTYTIDTTDRQAFVYKLGDPMAAAGFTATDIATFAETNLRTAGGQTNNNADCIVWGISIEFLPTSEPRILAELVRQVFIHMSLNAGSARYLIGKLSDFPGGGGIYGQQHTKLEAGQLVETIGPMEGYLANGNPMASNFWLLKRPFRWNSLSTGKPDANLSMVFTPGTAITVSATDRAAVAGAAPGASGRVEAFTSPANLARGTFAELRVKLATVEIADRSQNS